MNDECHRRHLDHDGPTDRRRTGRFSTARGEADQELLGFNSPDPSTMGINETVALEIAPVAMAAARHDMHDGGPDGGRAQHTTGPDARRGGRRHLLTPGAAPTWFDLADHSRQPNPTGSCACSPAAPPPSTTTTAHRYGLHERNAVMTIVRHRQLPGGDPAIVYTEGGSEHGQPLVLLHGLSANATSWAPVIARTAPEWRSYAVDLRGHGRSARTPGHYRLEDYVDDADRLLQVIGEPAVVVGHSLGSIVAASLAQDRHPLVAAVFLEDPPLYLVEPGVFADSALARGFAVLRDHIQRMQHDGAPVETYRDLLAASPHPGGGRLGDHLHDDALWSRAGALAQTDPDAIAAVHRRDHVRRLRPGPAAAPPRPGRAGRPGA